MLATPYLMKRLTWGFQTLLDVEVLPTGRLFKLMSPLIYTQKNGVKWTIPTGFVTDLATVPRIFWAIYPPEGKYGEAAVVHDFLCNTSPCPRVVTDYVFREAMESCGVCWFTRWAMWAGVRGFAIVARRK